MAIGSLKSLKTLRSVDSGRQKAVRVGELPALSNIINGSLKPLKTFGSADCPNSAVRPRASFGEGVKYGMDLHEIRRKFPKKRSAAARKYYFKLIRT